MFSGSKCSCACVRVRVYVCAVPLPAVTGLQLLDVTHNALRARWDSVDGASGYMLLYAPVTGGQRDEKEVMERKEEEEEAALLFQIIHFNIDSKIQRFCFSHHVTWQ